MSETQSSSITRRQLLKDSGRVAAATAVVGMALPKAFAADDPTIQIALVGCGGRGTGAAVNAMSSPNGPVKLVAMADVFDSKMDRSYTSLSKKMGDQVDVPPEKRFIGFDGYKESDGLPASRRHRHSGDSARVSLGPLRLRRRKEP